jgi:hypothetical protein
MLERAGEGEWERGKACGVERFECAVQDFRKCDLLIVSGTSLKVQPFAGLINDVPRTCPRVLINRESAGEKWGFTFHSSTHRNPNETVTDVFLQSTAEDGFSKVAELIGPEWAKQLQTIDEAILSDFAKRNPGLKARHATAAPSPPSAAFSSSSATVEVVPANASCSSCVIS